MKILRQAEPGQLVADAAAATSIGGAGWAWLSHVNEILTLVATIIAIISGIFAIRYHYRKVRDREKT